MEQRQDRDQGLHLRYCIFDWDDNIVHMPTRIWMERVSDGTPVRLSTADYARRRHDSTLRHAAQAFREFNDETGDFAADLRRAMAENSEWRGPALGAFRRAVLDGRLFAVITARSHAEATMRAAVREFLTALLSEDEWSAMLRSLRRFKEIAKEDLDESRLVDEYLSLCSFTGVSNPEFRQRSGTTSVEEGKKYATRDFVKRIMDLSQVAFKERGTEIASVSFGMSDDDRKNVEAVDEFFRDELSQAFTRVKFVVFDTGVGGGRTRRLKPHISDPDAVPPLKALKAC